MGKLPPSTDAGTNNIVLDWFAEYATPDAANNIPAGSELLNVYTARLTQMIKAGLGWDFWFGTDGWNGLNLEGYSWDSATASSCYGFSVQELNDYGNWSRSILPSGWNPDRNVQMATEIIGNSATLNAWYQYWQIQFAQLYAQIKQAFINAGESASSFHTIGSIDDSTPESGNLGADGMYNMTDLANAHAIDYFYSDQEGNWLFDASGQNMVGRDDALDAAYARGFGVQPIIGLQPVNALGAASPLWSVEQSYLQQAVNYIWVNGARYAVDNPNIIMMQYPSSSGFQGWTTSEINQLFSFIKSTAAMLKNANPAWLGPTYLQPDIMSGSFGDAVEGFNFSFAQWGMLSNVQNQPSHVISGMNNLLLDPEGWATTMFNGVPALTGVSSQVMNMFVGGQLNLWVYYSAGRGWQVGDYVFNAGASDTQIANELNLAYDYGGNVANPTTFTIAGSSQSVISGYQNQVISTSSAPNYQASGSMIPLASYTSLNNNVAIGKATNTNGANEVYSCGLSFKDTVYSPREINSRLLYWASNSPVVPSESLIDLKVYQGGNTIYVPMTDQLDVNENPSFNINPVSFSLSINPSALGLGPVSNYVFSWASNPTATWTESSWGNATNLTLKGGTDMLIISLK
jgi:hypothetical protein